MSSPLVGRTAELSELRAALAAARDGHGSLVLLLGEPGIGKTRLADELERLARAEGAHVTVGRAYEDGAPFSIWSELLAAIGAADALAPLQGADDRHARARAFEHVAAALAARRGEAPLVAIFDDLHAADVPSLLLLARVARQARSMPLLLLGTARDGDPRTPPAVRELLARLAREGATLALPRLSREQTLALISAAGAGPEALEALFQSSDGNPLFLEEWLRLLKLKGAKPSHAALRQLPIPDGIAAIVGERLQLLDPNARKSLARAAALGREVSTSLTARVLGVSPTDLDALLVRAAELGLVVADSDDRWRFSHELARATLERELARDDRARLHARIAEQLETSPPTPTTRARITHHLFEALAVVGPQRAVKAALAEAESARASLAFEHAGAQLERALTLLESAGHPALEAEVWSALGTVRICAGAEHAGKQACRRAADLARQLKAPQLFAQSALSLGMAVSPGGADASLVALLEEALSVLPPDDGSTRARLLARLAGAMQPAADPAVPMRLAREALAMSARLDDDATRRDVLFSAGAALVGHAHPDERLPLDLELATRSAQAGDRVQQQRAHARIFFDHLELGALDRADAARAAHEQLAGGFGQRTRRWLGLMMRALLGVLEGRFAEAEAFAFEARALHAEGDAWANRVHALHRFGLLSAAGRHGELVALEAPLLEALRRGPNGHELAAVFGAALRARVGDAEGARSHLLELGAESARVKTDPLLLSLLAEAAAAAGDTERAERLAGLLAPRRGTLAAWGAAGMLSAGPVSLALARCARACGKEAEATQLLDEVIAFATGRSLRPALEQARSLSAARAPKPTLELTQEDETHWVCRFEGHPVRVKSTRGLAMLARLIEQPGREFHVLDLSVADGEGLAPSDAGEVLDEQAIAEYRSRLREVASELDEAHAWADAGRSERLRAEAEALEAELKRAVGLGGRQRRVGSDSERARVNVQRRLKGAIEKLETAAPRLGRHLSESIRTGTFCSYSARSEAEGP